MTTRSGCMKVLDRRALAQELGVGDHRELCACRRHLLRTISLDHLAGADGYRALGDDDLVAVQVLSPIDSATSRMNVRSAEPSAAGGVPTAMNTACASSIAGAEVGREAQPPLVHVLPHQRPRGRARRSGSRRLRGPPTLAASLSTPTTCHAEVGQAGACHQADVAAADDADVHQVRRFRLLCCSRYQATKRRSPSRIGTLGE